MRVPLETLVDIVSDLYDRDEGLQKRLDMVSLEEDPKEIKSFLKKEIASLKRSKRFVGYYESDALANQLDAVRRGIFDDLYRNDKKAAFLLMEEFLDLHPQTFDRVDDSNGVIGDIFRTALEDLGKIAKESLSVTDTVDLVLEKYKHNEYGIYDDIITDFKESLKEEGLNLLKERIKQTADFDMRHALQEIADCQNDVEGFMEACSTNREIGDHDYLEIAKRLNSHKRGEEALQWLRHMSPSHSWQNDQRELKIQALELMGKNEEAQEERIHWFKKTLRLDIYEKVLSHMKSEESFRERAIKHALEFKEPHQVLSFLIGIKAFEVAAQFVRTRYEELSQNDYYVLRPAAKALTSVDPIAATLLYRNLVEGVLERAQTKYYHYGAKDLVACGTLNEEIREWGDIEPHAIYIRELLEEHKRKLRFWHEYGVLKAVKK